ncbi:hypothetical protein X885_531 [Burkholderia pseudomallei MSHR4372]|nr:hypothetical protein X885_531 [Burkholderia pseudomallei MSHR4372]
MRYAYGLLNQAKFVRKLPTAAQMIDNQHVLSHRISKPLGHLRDNRIQTSLICHSLDNEHEICVL